MSFEVANKIARNILLYGEDEAASGLLTLKNFATGEQQKAPLPDLLQHLQPKK